MVENNFIREENIILDLKGETKVDIFSEILDFFIESEEIVLSQKETLMQELLNREAKGSTAIGDRIAIPHCKTNLIDNIIAVLGISRKGVAFDAAGNQIVNIIVLTISPKNASFSHINFLAFISNVFKNKQNCIDIQKLNSRRAIYDFISNRNDT